MKKKSCLTLALILVMVQVISLFAILPASAASYGRSYSIYPAFGTMKTDGAVDDWASIPVSESFKHCGGGAERAEDQEFNATFRAAWSPIAGDSENINLHILVEVTDNTRYYVSNWASDNFRFNLFDEKAGSTHYYSGWKHVMPSGYEDYLNGGWGYTLTGPTSDKKLYTAVVDTENGYVIELNCQIHKQAQIKFDIVITDNITGKTEGDCFTDYLKYSWNGAADSNAGTMPEGIGYIIDTADTVSTDKSYDMYQWDAATAPSDGCKNISQDEMDEWAKIPATTDFSHQKGDANYTETDFSASLKAAWMPVEGDATKIKVYFFLEVKDTTRTSGYAATDDAFYVTFKNGDKIFYNQALYTHNYDSYGGWYLRTSGDSKFLPIMVGAYDATGGWRGKLSFTMDKADLFNFDICVQDGYNNGSTRRITWNGWGGAAAETATGVVRVIDTPIAVNQTVGASVRVDVDNPEFSGIRFANSVDMTRYNALIAQGATITTGTLIVPTNSLTVKGIADDAFTKENLIANGLDENTHFYDIVNVDNEWVDGAEGTWYATIYDIQGFTRRFSAVGYISITLNGTTTTVYGDYTSSNARSIAQVAKYIMMKETMTGQAESENGWTIDQEAILTRFFTKEVQP